MCVFWPQYTHVHVSRAFISVYMCILNAMFYILCVKQLLVFCCLSSLCSEMYCVITNLSCTYIQSNVHVHMYVSSTSVSHEKLTDIGDAEDEVSSPQVEPTSDTTKGTCHTVSTHTLLVCV